MRFLSALAALFLISTAFVSDTPDDALSFEIQMHTLHELGITLNEGIDQQELMRWEGGKAAFENEPWSLLYITLGQETEKRPWRPLSDQCWNFDPEAIEDHGAYVSIMRNISRITGGDLVFEDLKDYVDIDEGKAWVSFRIGEDQYHWDLKVDNDWADGDLFDRVQALAKKYQLKKYFTFYHTGGQDFVLGYHDDDEVRKINNRTRLGLERLNAKGQIY